jgi:Glycosyl transferase family 2
VASASYFKNLIPPSLKERMRCIQIRRSFRHLHGPKVIEQKAHQAIVTCLVKNGAFYIDQFIDHYLGMGFQHIVFLDNGSSDDTVSLATRHQRVTMYQSLFPVSAHQRLLKRELALKASPSGWCLDVDIDEFFEYPYSDVVSLAELLRYLDDNGYTAVVTQMLDMFSDQPLSSLAGPRREVLKDVHRFWDIADVKRTKYREDPLSAVHGRRNTIPHPELELFWGGVRLRMWGTHCLLTKHSLFKLGSGINLFPHVHFVGGAALADISGVLLHYKFASNASADASQNQAAFATNRHGYSKVIDSIRENPDLRITSTTTAELRSVSQLVDAGFLFASDQYRALAVESENRVNGR